MAEQRLCRNPDCQLPIDPARIEAYDATTCPGDVCRSAARRHETGYNAFAAQARSQARLTANSRRSRASGLQVSYRKAVEGCIEALRECGVDPEEAELISEKWMRAKLSDRQRARLEEMELEPEPGSDPATLPLPTPTPLPVPTPEPDLEPAAEDTPSVRIFQRQRDDNDALVWVEIDRVPTRASAGVALTKWLNEQYPEPLTGSYRAEGNGTSAETTHTAVAA
jgi:hypothetical protein